MSEEIREQPIEMVDTTEIADEQTEDEPWVEERTEITVMVMGL